MKETKALSESQIELLVVKSQQIQNLMQQAQALQKQNMQRIGRMKLELNIPEKEIGQWQLSRDGKNFEREKQVKKTTVKGNKKKK